MATSPKSTLLEAITAFCQEQRIAESTFGKRAVNDGKFVSRLRNGARVTPETWDRVIAFMSERGAAKRIALDPASLHLVSPDRAAPQAATAVSQPGSNGSVEQNFRFFDNRQKYLLFVNTCSEKEVVARRVGMELANLRPTPPAVRIFDAGMGDGSVLVSAAPS